MFVTYRSPDEVLITTIEQEDVAIKEWFDEAGRDCDSYDREEHLDSAVCIRNSIRIS